MNQTRKRHIFLFFHDICDVMNITNHIQCLLMLTKSIYQFHDFYTILDFLCFIHFEEEIKSKKPNYELHVNGFY